MPRKKIGTVHLDAHGDHWDFRFDVSDGHGGLARTKRTCMPSPTRERGETPEGAKLRAKEEARAEARQLHRDAWAIGATLETSVQVKPAGSLPHGAANLGIAPETGETIDDYADRWLEERRDATESTHHLRGHVLPVLGLDTPIAAITRADVERVVRYLDDTVRAGNLAWKTAVNVWGTVTKMFDDACNAKRVELRALADKPNPTDKVRGPDRGEERQSAWLFPREAAVLLASEEIPEWWRRCYALALYTGLRQGELAVLRVADVVLEAGYISVHKARDRVTAGIKSTKGKRARRVPIEPSLRPFLENLVRRRGGDELLVRTPKKTSMANELRVHLRAAKIDREELHADDEHRRPLSYHDLRHTYATWLAVRGENQLVIQARLGHANVTMTQKYIEAAEAVGHGDVGAPFAPLPPAFGGALIPPQESSPTIAKYSKSGAGDGIRTLQNNEKTSGFDVSGEASSGVEVTTRDDERPTGDVLVGDRDTKPENLLSALGQAIAAAAREGRADVAGELAGIVSRLSAEQRAPTLERAGVAVLDVKRGRRG
jgi:integrase